MATLHLGDCRDVLATMSDDSIDAIVTDPPYELGFMGKAWDASGIAYDVTMWRQCLRVLKPGGHLLSFGGSRTYHRMAVAIEDAGFEIRDQMQWIYGSGFPKSLDVSKAMDKQAGAEREIVTESRSDMFGEYDKTKMYKAATQSGVMNGLNASVANEFGHTYATITAPATDLAKQWQGFGTALKPSHEPIVVARKPLIGTVADNVMQWGTGAINIDGCRIPSDDGFEKAWNKPVHTNISNGSATFGTGKSAIHGTHAVDISANKPTGGRWPANVLFDEDAAEALDAQSGVSVSSKPSPSIPYGNKENANTNLIYGKGLATTIPNVALYGDTGGASRFFYVAKASKAEREAGLGQCDGRANHHPTVKPIALMRYLVRLVTPKGGIVLDPFTGSGTTGCAAVLEGFDFVGIEQSADYLTIADARIAHHGAQPKLDL